MGKTFSKMNILLVTPPLEKGDKGGFEMAKAGIAVLRFSDREVLNNLNAVLEQIWRQ